MSTQDEVYKRIARTFEVMSIAWNAKQGEGTRMNIHDAFWSYCRDEGAKLLDLQTEPLRAAIEVDGEKYVLWGGHRPLLDSDPMNEEATGERTIFYGGLAVTFAHDPEDWTTLCLTVTLDDPDYKPTHMHITQAGKVEVLGND